MHRSGLVLFAAALLAACGGGEAPEGGREAAAAEPSAGEDAAETAAEVVDPTAAPDAPGAAEPDDAGETRESVDLASGASAGVVARSGAAAAEAGSRSGSRADPAAAADTDPTAAQVLRRAEEAYGELESMSAEFVQEVTVPLLDSTQRSRGRIYHRRPDRFLMRFSEPAGDVVVADGRYLWMYYPSVDDDQVIRTSIAGGGQQVDLQRELLHNASERFDVREFSEGTAAGRAAWVLDLVPREPAAYRSVRVWIDKDDALVRRFEVVEENESVRRLELSNFRPNVELPDSLFRFTPPPGAEVFDQ